MDVINLIPAHRRVENPLNLINCKQTTELCLEAVQQDGMALQHCQNKILTYEICLTAVKHTGEAIRHVPKRFMTPELCREAVHNTSSKAQHPSLEYYFENLSCFADVIKTKMERYNKELRNISSFVQSFGGDGYTHGCIVDIDFYSHIYLDPTSGEITLYWASSMKERFVYPNLEHLLKKCCPQLYGKYRKVLAAVPNSLVPFQKSSILKRETRESDMMMYKYSRLISCLQFAAKANIVRAWSDDLLAIETPPLPAKLTE